MNKEKKEKNKIIFFRRIKYSIRNFEKYPSMAELGVKSAIGYLSKIIIIFAIFLGIIMTYQFVTTINTFKNYLQDGSFNISYQNGDFNISSDKLITANTSLGFIIINTMDENEEVLNKYEETINSNELEIKVLKDKLVVYNSEVGATEYNYKEILEKYNIPNFTNEDIIDYTSRADLYIVYLIMMLIYVFIIYFISSLMDIVILSIFGLLTCLIAKIKMKYKYVFSMSVYAITISLILELIYNIVNILTGFEIKYFDIMYTSISYICLAAAIFMIKSDVVKQYIEMIKIKEQQKEKINEENKEMPDEKDEDKEKKKKDSKNEKNNDETPDVDSEGSNA